MLRDVFVTWAGVDPDGAVDAADALEEPARTDMARSIIVRVENLDDVTRNAIAARFSLHRELNRVRSLEAAETDAAEAWHAALSMDDESRADSLYQIAAEWARANPVVALEAAGKLSDGRLREDVGRTVVLEWMRVDQDAALDWVLALPHPRRRILLETALRRLAYKDPKVALDTLRELNDPAANVPVGWDAASSWAAAEPYAAFDWAISQGPSEVRQLVIHRVINALGHSSPEEALSLASRLDDPLERSEAFRNALRTWARSDPRAAARWLDASGQPIGHAARVIVGEYAELDLQEAFDWLMTQDASQHRHADYLVREVAIESPARARRMINRMPDGPAKQSATRELLLGWIETDPRAAIREIPQLDLGVTGDIYKRVFRTWSRSDPEAATAFLNHVPAESRDAAVMGIISQALNYANDTTLAEQMYDRLVSEEMRRQTAATLYSRLHTVEPERAKRYR